MSKKSRQELQVELEIEESTNHNLRIHIESIKKKIVYLELLLSTANNNQEIIRNALDKEKDQHEIDIRAMKALEYRFELLRISERETQTRYGAVLQEQKVTKEHLKQMQERNINLDQTFKNYRFAIAYGAKEWKLQEILDDLKENRPIQPFVSSIKVEDEEIQSLRGYGNGFTAYAPRDTEKTEVLKQIRTMYDRTRIVPKSTQVYHTGNIRAYVNMSCYKEVCDERDKLQEELTALNSSIRRRKTPDLYFVIDTNSL